MPRSHAALTLTLTCFVFSTAAFAKATTQNLAPNADNAAVKKMPEIYVKQAPKGTPENATAKSTSLDEATNDSDAMIEDGVQSQSQIILPGENFVAPPGALYTTSDDCA